MLRGGRPGPWAGALTIGWLALSLGQSAVRAASADPPTSARQGRHLSGRLPGKPAYLWLWYADGSSALPEDGPYCTGLKPPAFKCSYGATLADCQRAVLSYLDDWYAGFNLVFTLTRPPSGDYYTMIITSQGAWCDQSAAEGGVAPFNCNDNPGLAGFAFECGASAHACAALIAHEHGHLIGLEHTGSNTDVMHESVLASSTGFDNRDNRTIEGYCQAAQNSYQQMLAALGPWPGGSKPSALSFTPDAGVSSIVADAADTQGDAPSTGGVIGKPPIASDAGGVSVIGGFDALTRPLPVLPDAAAQPSTKSQSGCSVARASQSRIPGLGLVALAWLGRLVRRRIALRRARPVPRACDATRRA
jgi:hypothetical protein